MTSEDRGSIIVAALVIVLIGGTIVGSMTSLNIAVIDAQISRNRQAHLESEVDAELALTTARLRRSTQDPASACPNLQSATPGISVLVTCSTGGSAPRIPPPGLVATLNASTQASQTLPTWAGGIGNAVQGAVVINTGSLTVPKVSVLPDRRIVDGQGPSPTWATVDSNWSAFASAEDGSNRGGYPPLPPIPLYERPGSQVQIGSCNVYFPGRYLGTSSLTLSSGQHYFVSGDYYFERTLTVSNGARVVMGAGSHAGCSDDDAAIANGRAPRRHLSSGRGATLLLGGSARLVVQESSLTINARDDDERMSVRTVGFGTSTSTIVVPADSVRLENGTTVGVAAHSTVPDGSSTPATYKTTTLSPTSAFAVDVRLNGSTPSTNRVIVEGRIFVPHAGLRMASTSSTYAISMTGGIVTARLTTSLTAAPQGAESGFEIGVALAESAGTVVEVETRKSEGRRTYSSTAVYEAKQGSWQLIGRTRRHLRNDA